MIDLISEILVKIEQHIKIEQPINKKPNSEEFKKIFFIAIAKGILSSLIVGTISLIISDLLIPDFASWSIAEKINEVSLTLIVFLTLKLITQAITEGVKSKKAKRVNQILEDTEDKEQEIYEAVVFEPTLFKELEKSENYDSLAAVASVDLSKLTLKELQAVLNYVEYFIPDPEDELKAEPFTAGYKPKRLFPRRITKKL